MSKDNVEYVFSDNEEYWSHEDGYSTPYEAMLAAVEQLELEEDDSFFIGVKRPFELKEMSGENYILSLLEDSFHEDQFGEWSEKWESDVRSNKHLHEIIARLLKQVNKQIIAHHKPLFFTVKDINHHTYLGNGKFE